MKNRWWSSHVAEGLMTGKVLLFLTAVVLAWGVMAFRWAVVEGRQSFEVGRASPMTYYALTDASFVDLVETEKLRKRVKDGILGVLVRGTESGQGMNRTYDLLLNNPQGISFLTQGMKDTLKKMSQSERQEILDVTRSIHEDLNRDTGLSPDQKDELIWRRLESAEPDPARANVVFQLLLQLTENQDQINTMMTAQVRALAAEAIDPLSRRVTAGQTLVNKGDLITPEVAVLLRNQGYPERHFWSPKFLLVALASILCVLWIRSACEQQKRWNGEEPAGGWLWQATMMACCWFCEAAGLYFGCIGLGMIPLGAFAYFTQPQGVAFQLALSIGLAGAFITNGSGSATFSVSALCALVGVLSAKWLFRGRFTRTLLFIKTLVLGICVSLTAAVLGFLLTRQMTWSPLYSVAGSLMCSAFVVLFLPVFESLFDLLSPLRLMELTHPTHPLLRRLLIEAPGTYHHTQMVGNLAEAVAEKLGLNPLLLRAGAAFHDIGKLGRPSYFIENQLSGVNPHDNLSPTMSAMVILNHVKEGLEIAEEFHLPKRIRDFIPEHHGTTTLTYFMKKAEAEGHQPIESQFSYPGPKPRSKETAVLMLADSTEASARSMSANIKRVSDISNLIDSVINSKLKAGQLDEAPFTTRDIALTKEALFEALRSMYHTRDIKPIEKKASYTTSKEKKS